MVRISPFARAYLRRRTTEKMEDACQIWHPRENVSFDRTTGVATAFKGDLLYEGPCRIWQVTPGSPTLLGDEVITQAQTMLSLPFDAPVQPRRDDVVYVTKATDPALQGFYFQAIASSFSGGLRASRRFQVSVMKNARKDTW